MLTQTRLKQIASYSPITGAFSRDGRLVRSVTSNGYLRGMIDGKSYRLHRLAFLYMTGKLPPDDIDVDHINQDRKDNRWENLRLVSRRVNMQNAKRSAGNTSGFTGVTWDQLNTKWIAQIMVGGKCIKLGRFLSYGDAVAARQEANKKYSFHKNHGAYA